MGMMKQRSHVTTVEFTGVTKESVQDEEEELLKSLGKIVGGDTLKKISRNKGAASANDG